MFERWEGVGRCRTFFRTLWATSGCRRGCEGCRTFSDIGTLGRCCKAQGVRSKAKRALDGTGRSFKRSGTLGTRSWANWAMTLGGRDLRSLHPHYRHIHGRRRYSLPSPPSNVITKPQRRPHLRPSPASVHTQRRRSHVPFECDPHSRYVGQGDWGSEVSS